MNLVTDPWLPVTNSNNQLCYISLNQLFEQPDEWLDLVLRPHERVSVIRFLICVVQAALDGPNDPESWNEALGEIPGAGLKYFEKELPDEKTIQDRFELFDKERPFLQVSKLEPGNEKSTGPSVTKLDSTLAVGENGSTLFDHGAASALNSNTVDRKMLNRNLAVSLIAFVNYSPSGTQSSAKLDGELISHSSGAMDAPCANQNMLHTFVVKNTLIKTIHCNLIDKEACGEFYGDNSWGKPVWEINEPKCLADKESFNNSVNTYLGRLVPLSRFCKLKENSPYFIYCKGFQYSTKPKKKTDSKRVYRDFKPEPTSTVLINSEGEYSLLKSGINAPWREISALVSKRSKGSNGGALSLRYLSQTESFDMLVVGQARDSENVAKILDLVESKVHIPEFMFDSTNQYAYESNIKICEKKSYTLFRAVEKYRTTVDDEWKGIVKRVKEKSTRKTDRKYRNIFKKHTTNHYWTLIEKQRHLLMNYISLLGSEQDQAREKAKNAWLSAISQAGRETYKTLCSQESPRQIRAYVAGWQILYPYKSNQQEVA